MKITDFLNFNLSKKFYFNGKEYYINKDSDGFFTINCENNICLILNDDKFSGEDKELESYINSHIFNKQLMDITKKIFDNQSKMIKFMLR